LGTVVVPQGKDAKGQPVVMIKPLSSAGIVKIKRNWRIAYVCGAKDGFLNSVIRSAEAVKGIDAGSKLFEIDGLGHGGPADITDIMAFIFSPREASKAKAGSSSAFNPEPVLAGIRTARTSNPVRAKELMVQLWRNHPEVHANPAVTELLDDLERLP
jgi:hypothetical protein